MLLFATGLTTVVVLIEVMNEVHHPKVCEDVSSVQLPADEWLPQGTIPGHDDPSTNPSCKGNIDHVDHVVVLNTTYSIFVPLAVKNGLANPQQIV